MGDLGDLAKRLRQLRERLPVIVATKTNEVAMTIVRDLTVETPVDQGAALSNWQVSLDSPISAPIPPYAPSPRGRMINGVWTHMVPPEITRAANAPAAIEQALSVIAARAPGQPIFITNVLPYAELLDQGSSEQAPAGFVDRAVVLARESVDKLNFLE